MRTLLASPPRRISRVRGWHKDRWIETSQAILELQIADLPLDWQNLRPENLETAHWVILSDTFSSFDA